MHANELASSVLRFFHLRDQLPDVDELAAQIERDEKAAQAYRELHAVAEKVVEVLPEHNKAIVAEMKSQLGPKHAAKAKPKPRTLKAKPKVIKKAAKAAPKKKGKK